MNGSGFVSNKTRTGPTGAKPATSLTGRGNVVASNTKRKPSGKGRGKWKHHRRDDGCSRGSGGGRGGDRGNDLFEQLKRYQKVSRQAFSQKGLYK